MFTYVIEEGNNRGSIFIYKGIKKSRTKGMLYFTEEKGLIEALKIYKKTAVLVPDDDPEMLKEGERLSKKLGLDFQHA